VAVAAASGSDVQDLGVSGLRCTRVGWRRIYSQSSDGPSIFGGPRGKTAENSLTSGGPTIFDGPGGKPLKMT
jgi:hypothetical protein